MDIDKAFEELYEGWKKGTYTITDVKTGKVLGKFKSGAKAQKAADDIFQKGDYDAISVEVDEGVEKEFAKFVEELDERKMTDGEKEEREEIVKKLKPKLQSFKDRYGDDAKKVMYATATKQAMEEVEIDEMPNRANMEKINTLIKKYSG